MLMGRLLYSPGFEKEMILDVSGRWKGLCSEPFDNFPDHIRSWEKIKSISSFPENQDLLPRG
jgi:hypothetical protein